MRPAIHKKGFVGNVYGGGKKTKKKRGFPPPPQVGGLWGGG